MITIPWSPSGATQGASGGQRPPKRNSSRMIGGCAGANTASAAASAGRQVRLGVGLSCDGSQTTSGDATGDVDEGADAALTTILTSWAPAEPVHSRASPQVVRLAL